MKKWQKLLVGLFATIALGIIVVVNNVEVADAGLLSTSAWLTAPQAQVHRGHATTAAENRATARVRVYIRRDNGSLSFEHASEWADHGGRTAAASTDTRPGLMGVRVAIWQGTGW